MDTKNVDLSNVYLNSLDCVNIPIATEKLNLDKNRFLHLPDELGTLTNLSSLSVACQLDIDKIDENSKPALQALPDNIANLTGLKELNVHNNALRSLPRQISALNQLQTLDLRMNLFTEFPKMLCSLTSLKALKLCGNQIIAIPPCIKNLTNLEELTMIGNKLKELPMEISYLHHLRIFALQNNQLQVLPTILTQLQQLVGEGRGIHLSGNSLIDPPMEVVRLGTAKIFDYLEQHLPVQHLQADSPRRTIEESEGRTAMNITLSGINIACDKLIAMFFFRNNCEL